MIHSYHRGALCFFLNLSMNKPDVLRTDKRMKMGWWSVSLRSDLYSVPRAR
jgi:hypothetical protein